MYLLQGFAISILSGFSCNWYWGGYGLLSASLPWRLDVEKTILKLLPWHKLFFLIDSKFCLLFRIFHFISLFLSFRVFFDDIRYDVIFPNKNKIVCENHPISFTGDSSCFQCFFNLIPAAICCSPHWMVLWFLLEKTVYTYFMLKYTYVI